MIWHALISAVCECVQEAERLAYLQKQAQEKAERDAKLKDTYANTIAPEYFSQFGTSHR